MTEPTEQDLHKILRSFFADKGFTKFHTDTAKMFKADGHSTAGNHIIDTILIEYLISKEDFHTKDNGDWFFRREKDIEKDLTLSPYQQRESIKRLTTRELIETKRQGNPVKKYFRLDIKKFVNLLLSHLTFESKVTKQEILDSSIILSKDNNGLSDESTDEETKPLIENYSRGKKKEPNGKLHPIIEEWNLHPRVRKHKDSTAKFYTKMLEKLKRLKNNTFYQVYRIDPEYIKKNHIDLDFQFDDDSILAGIDFLHDAFTEGFEPVNKDWLLNKSLDDLLYSPFSKTSVFLKYLFNPPKELEMAKPAVYEEWWDAIFVEGFLKEEAIATDQKELVFRKGLNSIDDYFDWLKDNEVYENHRVRDYLPDADDFFDFYLRWLRDRYGAYELNPYMIGTKAKGWYEFIYWLEDAIEVKGLDKRR